MSHRADYDNDDADDEVWDDDSPDDEGDESDLIPCPACGVEIYEDAPQCPHCGEYVTRGSKNSWSGKPGWYILLGLSGIVAVIAAMLFAQ